MVASYFNRGQGHSLRGLVARQLGAVAWSKLPAKLRRGLSSKEAADLQISDEWHRTGKFAQEVFVYYPEQVQAFWDVIDASPYTLDELREARNRHWELHTRPDDETFRHWYTERVQTLRHAQEAAEDVRCKLVDD